MTIQWSTPVWMWPLLLIVAVGAVVWTVYAYRQTRPRPSERLRILLTSLRAVALLLLVVAVAGPILVNLQQRREPAQLVVVIEDSGSMEITDMPDESGTLVSRWQSALSAAARIDSAFSDQDPPVDVVVLRGNGLDPIRPFYLDDTVIPSPTAYGTDLNGLVQKIDARFVGRPVRATVVISDGQETVQTGTGVGRTGRRAVGPGRTDVPLSVIGVGDATGPADRVLQDLRYPDSAFAGDEIIVEMVVTHRFTTGRAIPPIVAQLRDQDARLVAEVEVPVNDVVTPLEMSFRPQTAGLQVYTLELSPLDNERFRQNNAASLAVNVSRQRSRVLLLADRPGWDVRFLAQAAALEPRLELSVVHPSADGLVFADSLLAWTPPTRPEDWLQFDGLVIAGWSQLPSTLDWGVLKDAVARGLGLLVLPGVDDLPATATVALSPPAGLLALLPVQAQPWRWLAGPLPLESLAGLHDHPVLTDVVDTFGPQDGGDTLTDLPPLRRVAQVQTIDGAVTLLQAKGGAQSDPDLRTPVLVADVHEEGRVVWLGGRRIWELAFWEQAGRGLDVAEDEHPGRRLLRNLLVWTASGEQEAGLALVGRRKVFQEGERIRLTSRWRDMRGRPVSGRTLSLQLTDQADSDTTAGRTFALVESRLEPGRADVELPPLPPGAYLVQLIGDGDPRVLGETESLVVTPHSVEQTQVRLDARRLQLLANRSDGVYHRPGPQGLQDDVLTLLKTYDWQGVAQERRARFDFRNAWPFLVVMSALLGLEWWLRRRNGLL